MKEPERNQDIAVSEVIGTVLLISLVVLASTIITVAIFSQPQAQKIPSLSALISNQSQTVYIKHVGGDALQNGTYKILVDGSDVTSGIAIPALWSIGNTLTYTKPGITPPVIVQVVYTGAGSPDVIAVSYFGIIPAGGSIFMITASAGTGGTITPSGSVPVSFGANQTFVITNNTGYSIGNVVVDGTTSVGAVSSYTFSNVQVSHTISATFVAAPTISSISPTSGPIAGGTSVAITGTSFTSATAVMFGSSQATTFTVNNATSLNATSPAGSAGTVNITVTTPGGTSATSSADQFTYAAAPTISSISPTSGPIAGGTSVAITGTSFTGATAVMFGSSQATTFTVNNATSLNATSPAGSAGTVNITVTTPGGSATISYTYIVPTITGISPASGPTTGGTLVNITGTNLAGATSVTFGGTAATINSVTNTLINATTPPGSTGAVNVSVVTPNGTGTEAKAYTYGLVPTVASISPIAGPLTGSQSVTITGANFNGTISVYFGGNLAPGFTVINSTSIIATTPPGTAGLVSVWVITPYGSQFLINAYTYESAPTVTGVSPAAGLPAGGTSVTINGTNFIGATAVTFGTTAVTTFTVNTLGTQITVNSPSGTGTIDITVTTPSGTSATSSVDRYIYTTPITAVTITGTAQVASTLNVGALTPAGAIATYQWEYSSTSGGPYTNISGATASTFSVTSGYVSDYIEVAAAGSGGYSGTVTSAPVGPVSAEPLTAIGAITGTAQVGSILTAGSISPSGATVTYQWEYSTTSGGTYTAIPGATSSTYTMASAYVN
ncbi:MAG: IPT/TIG domain-containing protein, partial [Methanoregula sp.]